MQHVPPLEPDELLLRRILPRKSWKKRERVDPSGPVRVQEMRPRLRGGGSTEREHGLSCSRLRLTSPLKLLRDVKHLPRSDLFWVCAFRLRDVLLIPDPEGGTLRVQVEQTFQDSGHVVIVGSNGRPCPDTDITRNRLADVARLLTEEEVRTLDAGDPPPPDLA